MLLFFMVLGCTKDESFQVVHQNVQEVEEKLREKSSRVEFTIKTVYKEGIQSEPLISGLIQKHKLKILEGRKGADSQNMLVLDTDHAKYIAYGDSHSYTFAVTNSPKGQGLENVSFFFQKDGGYRIFLVHYDLTEKEIDALSSQDVIENDSLNSQKVIHIEPEDIDAVELDENFSTIKRNDVVGRRGGCPNYIYVPYCTYGNHPGGQTIYGDPCPGHALRKVCSGGGGGGTGGGGGNGGGSGGFGDSDDGGVVTVPITSNEAKFDNFFSQLSPVLKDFLNDNSLLRMQIEFFLIENDFSQGSISFGKAAIEALMGDGETIEGADQNFDNNFWSNNPLFPQKQLPSFEDFSAAYPKLNQGKMPANQVFNLIGGNVLSLANINGYTNACAARVSRALNYSGVSIPSIPGITFEGADNKYYFLGARNLFEWMKKTFGVPDLSLNQSEVGTAGFDFFSAANGNSGIYIMIPNYPAQFGASGHADIFNGSKFNAGGYLNPAGGLHSVNLWVLN